MREFTSPAVVTIADDATLTDIVMTHANTRPDAVIFRRRPAAAEPGTTTSTTWTPVTAAEFFAQVASLAAGFLAAGLAPGQRVGLLSRTRYEWTLTDYALWHAGLVTVPIYETSAPDQICWILGDSQAVGVVLETDKHATTVAEIRDQVPDLRKIWVIENGDLDGLAREGDAAEPAVLTAARESVNAASLASIIYTSGTTGRPKGCALTHRNLLFGATSAVESLPALFTGDTSALLFLPLAHVFARDIQVALVHAAVPVGHCPSTRSLQEDLAAFKPTLLLAVPFVFERLYAAAQQKAVDQSKGKIFALAAATAIHASEAIERGKVPLTLRLKRAALDVLVFRKLRAALGGDVQWVISGGAPLGVRLGHFFRGAGIPVLEGWGLTETTAAAAVNRPDAVKIGTVGPPLAGTTVRVADDGELLVHGEHVFNQYWADPDATAASRDADGFLHTGDIGAIDDDGFITITGRKKEILVTAGGKNVPPAPLEDRLRSHPLIMEAIVVGDRRPYIACLVTIDQEALATWKTKVGKDPALGLAALRDDPDLLAEIGAAVEEANRVVSRAESIRRFRILDQNFTEAGGQLTPTLKVRRGVVMTQFADEIEGMYSPTAPGTEMAP
ncbi:MAG TPA: long-chain fatty acid--CoA ligase [Acidothermaceae bacterium]|nr:long-chain fatty acid--CoA ligase [Acidothermaceae bacterium]